MKNDKQNTTSYSKTMENFESFRRGCILSRSNISFLKSNLMCSSLSMQIANIAMYELHIKPEYSGILEVLLFFSKGVYIF